MPIVSQLQLLQSELKKLEHIILTEGVMSLSVKKQIAYLETLFSTITKQNGCQ